MQKTLIFLITTLSLISCVVKKPIYQSTSQVHSGAIKVYAPQYSITKKKLNYKPFLVGMVIAGLGGYGFYDLETNPNTQLKEKDKLGFGVVAGLGVTYMVAAILSKKGKTTKTEFITNNNFNDWLSKYNSKNNSNYVKLNNEGNTFTIIPKNNIFAFETEDKRLKEEAEKQRILAEQRWKEQQEINRIAREEREKREKIEREEAAIKAEVDAWDKVKGNLDENKYWIEYKNNFPNGLHFNEVMRLAEDIAFNEFKNGRENAIETYKTYFPNGKYFNIITSFEKEYIIWRKAMEYVDFGYTDFTDIEVTDLFYDLLVNAKSVSMSIFDRLLGKKRYEIYVNQKEIVQKFIPLLFEWKGNVLKNPKFSELEKKAITDFVKILNSKAETVIKIDDERISAGNVKIENAKKYVIGDNICLNLESISVDENGKEIKGTESKTLIRISISEFNPEKTRMKIMINEIFNLTKNKKVETYNFDNPKRVWTKGTQDWINPADWDLDICK